MLGCGLGARYEDGDDSEDAPVLLIASSASWVRKGPSLCVPLPPVRC